MSRARILEPYTRRADDARHRMLRVLLIGGLILLAMIMGFLLAILPMSFMIIPMTPILLLAALALWLAPDAGSNLDGAIKKLFLLYFAALMVWPDYVAFTMPGIGWFSPQRLVMGALFFVSLYALATSRQARDHVYDVVSHERFTYVVFMAFVLLQLMLALATGSISSRLFFAQIFWYYMFVLAAWTFSNPNTIFRLYQIILVGFAIQCVYGAIEMRLEQVMWGPYIPPWLMVDPELLNNIIGDERRAGTDKYRVGSIYFTSVTFAEAMAMFVPFVILAIFYAKNAWYRIAAGALLIFAFVNAIFTDSRSAMVGFLIGTVSMIGLWAIQRYKRMKAERDIVAPAVIWAYPFGMLVVVLSVLFLGRVRVAVLGGGQHQPSNDAREAQWNRTIELVQQNPFGYGPFTAAERVGYTNRGGELTLDGFVMSLLVDYGILGILLFVMFFASCIYLGIRTFLNSESREEDLGAPLAVALTSFLIIKLVSSQTENHHIAYAFAGCIVALHWRQVQRKRLEQAQRQPAGTLVAEVEAPKPPPLGGQPGGYGVAVTR